MNIHLATCYIYVLLYLDGGIGSGDYLRRLTANQDSRPDLCSRPDVGCNHIFRHTWTGDEMQRFTDGNIHSLWVYGMNWGAGGTVQITNSPAQFGPCY